MKVEHQIQLGSDTYRSGDHTRLLFLETEASVDVPVNCARFAMSHPEQVSAAVGDVLEVEVGHDGYERVFTGEVSAINWGIDRVVIEGLGSFVRLANTAGHHYFDKPKSADIVQDLAGRAEVSTATVTTGVDFASYAIGSEKSYYEHIAHLSLFNGFLFYADPQDNLVFAAPSLGIGPAYRYGEMILQANIQLPLQAQSGVVVFGASPTSLGQGPDAAHWYAKKTVKGSAGGGEDVRRFYVPAARTTDSAAQIAQAIKDQTPLKRGQLRIIGDSSVSLGASVRLSDLPVSDQNGTYTVTSVRHRLNTKRGFTTQLELIELP